MKMLKILLAGFGLMAIVLTPAIASADVNDFRITSFDSDQTLSRADPQGELHIIEKINVIFTDYNHGILRAIPETYKDQSLKIKVNSITSTSFAPTEYTTYTSGGNEVLKIGSPSRTITGAQEYTIDYTVKNVIGFNGDFDELYWDVNGDQWRQTFEQVTMTLHLPTGLKQAKQPLCFTGSYGTKASDCTITTANQTITANSNVPLFANQTLTYVAGFDKGYFTPPTATEKFLQAAKPFAAVIIPILILGGGGWLYWFRHGRDPKGRGTIVPQYDAPDGLKPVEVGALMDFRVDNKDITATIISLAIRRYIKIIETKKDRLIGADKTIYSLELTNADFSALDINEKTLMAAIFSVPSPGEKVEVAELSTKLYPTSQAINKNVKKTMKETGYFQPSAFATSGAGKVIITIGLLIALAVVGFVTLGPLIIVGLVMGGVIGIVFLSLLASRTQKGVDAVEYSKGLKMYLDVAEKDRLDKLQGPNAAYASNAGEPVRTVELFEKLLPYAMVLGVEKNWAQQFEALYTSPPDWYGGNWTTFNAIYLTQSLNSGFAPAIGGAFSNPSSSGSSGFGGGGFSGGGGGGGGGGGW